jgi:hypothetical protein
MRCADTQSVTTIDALPAAAQALFADPQDDLFASLAWYRVVLACGMPNDAAAQFLFFRNAAVFPMQTVDNGRGFGSLTTLYTCLYRPLIAAVAGDVFAEFADACRSHALTRIDALPADWAHRLACIEAARGAGLSVRQFDHFGNWHEAVAGQSWTKYLADRPGTLRETVRRKLRRKHRFELIADGDRLEAGIADFESVYQRSWKEPEPFPDFNAALMRALAPLGMLRLGVLHVDGAAAAAQLWIVERHRATVLKLAHDEAFKAASPGTVLTALMLQRLLDEEHVPEIDFGRGDDAYKSAWASQRRQRIGLILANKLHPRGLAFLGRHAMGRVRASLRRASG